MKAQVVAALAIIAAIASFSIPANAQSRTAQSDSDNQTLSGDSLTGISNRSANQDFSIFFTEGGTPQPSPNNGANNSVPTTTALPINRQIELRLDDSSLSNSSVILQPGESFYGNDGGAVQVDLRE